MAYVAYHFHWSRDEIMTLPHKERHRWVREISEINRKINDSAGSMAGPGTGGGLVSLPSASGGAGSGFTVDLKQQFVREMMEKETAQGGGGS